ncbi:MAG: ATP synthase F1 subunit gamma [Opitutaceae bacterium]|nr:ATP synthase F1 subunit gamma [Opitutaceae bacterium]
MPSTRDIRRRIKSVKNTRQITKAMELVAASKMKRAQKAAIAGRHYAVLLAEILSSIAPRVEEVSHPLLEKRPVKTRGILIITTDKGLCGPLNSNLFRLVTEIEGDAKFASIGRKGTQFLSRGGYDLLADFSIDDEVTFSQVRVAAQFMVEQYLEGNIDTLEIIFPRFINTLVQESSSVSLLPVPDLETMIKTLRGKNTAEDEIQKTKDDREMLFEPDAVELLKTLLPQYINRQIYQFALNTKASEHSARMVAMKSANDNASGLLDDLTLEYNKARQAAITQEILELASAGV